MFDCQRESAQKWATVDAIISTPANNVISTGRIVTPNRMGSCPVITPGKTLNSIRAVALLITFFFSFLLYLKWLSPERKSLVSRRCPDAEVGMGSTPDKGGSRAGETFMYLVLIPWYVQIGNV